MTHSRWTPGPWTVHHFVDAESMPMPTECGLYEIEEANEEVTNAFNDNEPEDGEAIAQANAHLITAAPDLYEAAKYAQRIILQSDAPYREEVLLELDMALSKARGENQ